MKKGVSRGIFSNEAGLGTGSIAHACADTGEPVKQGMFGIFWSIYWYDSDLYTDCYGYSVQWYPGWNMAQMQVQSWLISGFTATYGNWVSIFTAIALCLFCIFHYYRMGLYGSRCMEYLSSEKWVKPFMVVYALVAIVGATMDLACSGALQRHSTVWWQSRTWSRCSCCRVRLWSW